MAPMGFSPSMVEGGVFIPGIDEEAQALEFLQQYIQEMEPAIEVQPSDIQYPQEQDPNFRRIYGDDGRPTFIEDDKKDFMLSPQGGIAFNLGEFLNNLPYRKQERRYQGNEIEGLTPYDQRGYGGDQYAPKFYDDYTRPFDRPDTLRDPRNPGGPVTQPDGSYFEYSVPVPGSAQPVLAGGMRQVPPVLRRV